MAVLWMIIKVILYSLLVIMGLILAIVLMALLLPIDYKIHVSYLERFIGKIKIKVFYIITIFLEQNEQGLQIDIRLCGKRIFPKQEKAKKKTSRPDEMIEPTHMDRPKQQVTQQSRSVKEENKKKQDNASKEKKIPSRKEKSEIEEDIKKVKKGILDHLREAWELVHVLWTDENRKLFLKAIKQLFKDLWYGIRPDYLNFELTIGRENPADTGELLALLAFLFPFYCRYGNVIGNFNEETLSGRVDLDGKFNLWRLIKPFLKLILNKSVRNYIHLILSIRKEEYNGNKTQ